MTAFALPLTRHESALAAVAALRESVDALREESRHRAATTEAWLAPREGAEPAGPRTVAFERAILAEHAVDRACVELGAAWSVRTG
jgi:hypothetical protein